MVGGVEGMTTAYLGADITLTAEWRQYAGGPMVDVDNVQITITPLAGGAAAIGPTATGVTNPATGVNAYVWTVSSLLAADQYLVSWSGQDPQLDTVTATEVVTVLDSVAIGAPYASLAKLKARLGIADSNTAKDSELTDRLDSATLDIIRYCGRQFGRDEVASERDFCPGSTGVDVDDFWTTEDLAIVPYLGVTSGTAWTVDGLTLEPLNGIVDGVPGWPYRRVVYGWSMSAAYAVARVRVTARWGWANVPKNVETACLLIAAMDNKAGDAPFGVAAFGDYAVRIKSNPMAMEKLAPYVKDPAKVGS
jgi:hypothetical protein